MTRGLIAWKPKSSNPKFASARIRCLDPLRELRRRGLPVVPFHASDRNDYRIVVLQKLYDPHHRELARDLKSRGCRIVLDLCDHPFYNPERSPKLEKDAEQLRAMLEVADVVTVPTAELGRHLPCPVTVIRDGIAPPPAWSPVLGRWLRGKETGRVELAWYGLAGSSRAPSGMRDLLHVSPLLEERARECPLRLTVISNSRRLYEKEIRPLGFPSRYLEWGSHGRFCALFPRYDVCLIPVDRNPYAVCKSNNRLALSLYLGVPVIADAIPSYREFEPFAVLDDWKKGLDCYLDDPPARARDAEAGRAYVEGRYLTRHAADEWWQLFERLLG